VFFGRVIHSASSPVILHEMIEEDEMEHVKVTAASKVARRIAVVACVATLGVGAVGCGSPGANVTPQAPTPTTKPTAVPTKVSTPPTTAVQSGGAGF
jgi:hypothetical protein